MSRERSAIRDKKLFLFDLDGVLYVGKENPMLVSGKSLISKLKQSGKHILILTNTSTTSSTVLFNNLQRLSFEITPQEIFTACGATASYLRTTYTKARCFLIGESGFAEELERAGHTIVENDAEVVVVGVDRKLTYQKLDRGLSHLNSGSSLVGAHRSRVYMDKQGPRLSVGPILTALEFASGKKAVTIGKPEAPMFEEAMRLAKVNPSETVMIGDQIETDVVGAKRMGIFSVLVTTGIDDQKSVESSKIKPDLVCSTADDIVDLI